ncbi:unnamed protein product [Coregonus sp. 'balchen']|nr:unnamed protein product [Coregonus sp. 'balchen']
MSGLSAPLHHCTGNTGLAESRIKLPPELPVSPLNSARFPVPQRWGDLCPIPPCPGGKGANLGRRGGEGAVERESGAVGHIRDPQTLLLEPYWDSLMKRGSIGSVLGQPAPGLWWHWEIHILLLGTMDSLWDDEVLACVEVEVDLFESFFPVQWRGVAATAAGTTRSCLHHLLVTNELLAGDLLMLHNTAHFCVFFSALRGVLASDRLDLLKKRVLQGLDKAVSREGAGEKDR